VCEGESRPVLSLLKLWIFSSFRSGPADRPLIVTNSRRKKCDEVEPVCGDCKRLDVTCQPRTQTQPPESNLIAQVASSQHSHDDVLDKHPLPGNRSLSDNVCGDDDDDDDDDENANERRLARAYLDWVTLIDDEGSVSNTARKSHLNDSSALIYRDRAARSPPPIHVDSALCNFAPTADPARRAMLAQWHETEQHLLNHFLQFVARALVVVSLDGANPFIMEVVPLAFENGAVQHAMLALSARHLCRVYPKFEDTLVRQQSLALHHLKAELDTCAGHYKYALPATLLLCLLEVSPAFCFHSY
jgi:transcriptional activator protein UGA3